MLKNIVLLCVFKSLVAAEGSMADNDRCNLKAYMIWKKYILIKLFIVTGFIGAFATPQVSNMLVYNGDTISIYMNTLPNEFYKLDTVTFDSNEYINRILNVNLFGDEPCWITDCGDGYRVMWEIIENQLYLIDIYSCCYYEDSIKADLTSLFKEQVINGKVKADWVTGNFISLQGKRLLYDHDMGTGGIFEHEVEFYFAKGKLTATKLYDNSKSRQSVYSQDQRKLQEYIYGNINWKDLPQKDSIIEVIVKFSANEKGIIDNVEVVRGYDETYDQEAVRVIKIIPEWDVYFQKGKHMRLSWYMPIIFSEENREKYEK